MAETTKVFKLSSTGKLTQKPYPGEFTFKTMPSFQDEMDFDAFYAEIIGPRPKDYAPPTKIHNYAYMLGFIQSRTLVAPDWWVNARFGRDIEAGDLNIIAEVFQAALEAELKLEAEVVKEGEKAKGSLKKSTPKE